MIGERLKEIREKTGMNKKEFANYIGIKYTTYNGYETGAREPDSDFLILISQKFDVSTDYLLGLQGVKEVLHSYKLKSTEYAHIEKYRDLDDHGKEMIDVVLEKEYDRCKDQNKTDKENPVEIREKNEATKRVEELTYLPQYADSSIVNAANAIPGASAADRQHDEDIMDDENF